MIFAAHRGLHGQHPENSLAAFRAAWEAGIQWCECDVHFCAGGEAVVLHDETLERTTGGSGRVADLLPQDLQRYKLIGSDQSPPMLAEVVRAMPAGARLMIEVKPPSVSKAFLELMANVPTDKVLIQSFHESVLEEMVDYAKDFPLAILIDDAGKIDRAARGKWPAVHLDHKLLTAVIADDLRRAGKNIGVWTVNDLPEIQRVLSLGAQTVISDMPPDILKFASGRDRGRETPGSQKSAD
ncbi:MAG TPA: glycerophosphodiester phosphodiesterase family protein [Tepidisphaeraceae bacterium]|nr:glycerophosphodiester phosphodiesterase family protein [Tepidisphaeraceae bacterium]